MNVRQQWSRLARWQRWSFLTALLVALYAALGFWVAPRVVQDQTHAFFLEQIGRNVQIGEVKINPFALTLSVSQFDLPDADGSPLLRFEELFVDFELSSIYWQALTFAEIRIQKPLVHPKVRRDGTLNVVDLIPRTDAAPPDGAQEAPMERPVDEEASVPPAILVHLLDVQEGRLAFSDFSHETPFEYEISPLNITVRDFGTRPDDESPYSFSASTGSGESLDWEGIVSVVPLYSSGQFTLAGIQPRTGWLYVQDNVLFEVVDGTVDLTGRYELDSRGGLNVAFDEGQLTVRNFEVVERETRERAVRIGEFDIEGIRLRYPEQTVQIDRIHSGQGEYHLKRFADGALRSQRMAQARNSTRQGSGPAPPVDEPSPIETSEGQSWSVLVSQILFQNQSIGFEDFSTQPPARLGVEIVELELQEVSHDLSQKIPTRLQLRIGETGQLKITGPIQPEPLQAELAIELEGLEIDLFEPYWASSVSADVSDGQVGFSGQVRAKVPDQGPPVVQVEGDLSVDDFYLLDLKESERITALRSLRMEGLELGSEPLSIQLERLLLVDPSARIVMGPTGATNVSGIVAPPPQDSASANDSRGQTDKSNGEASDAEVAVSIQRIEVQNASMDFEDRSVQPVFMTSLSAFSGHIDSISSNPEEQASLRFKGRLDGSTAVDLTGVASPLAEDPYVDLKISLRNMGLTQFTPYSGRYIGKAIERGKLFLEVEYELEGNQLVGENRLFLDQFTLGGKVPSEEALNLPVGLALALLKDRKGEIHIDLPVRGEIDDPEFSVGGIIFSALLNLITKVAMSPFSIMGGLVAADADDLRYIEFEAGQSTLEPSQNEKLDALAAALEERPVLSLEIKGEAITPEDGLALKKARLESDLQKESFREQQARWFGDKPDSVEDVVLDSGDRSRLIETLFRRNFGKDALSELNTAAV